MLNKLRALCALCGTSGHEERVRTYLKEQIAGLPGILELRTDALGNLLVHKQGKHPAARPVLVGAHMDEVGLIVTELRPDGRLSLAAVGGVDPDVVIGRALFAPGIGTGVAGAAPVHKLSREQREARPKASELFADFGFSSKEEAEQYFAPGDPVYFHSEFLELGGGRIASKAIDDRFGCAAMLCLLEREPAFDTWFCFFVQEEIGLRGSRAAAYAVAPAAALILETTTAADLDGVQGEAAVCRLGGGPVVPFMDRATIYDKGLYKAAFAEAARLGIPCQTKTRIAGGNDAGAVHQSGEGVRTLAISAPCRYLHSPYTVAQISDLEQCVQLAEALLHRIHTELNGDCQ